MTASSKKRSEPRALSLVFHLNQSTVGYASIAAATCYRPLVDFLRADERRRVTLHLSGTLITVLQWLEPDIIDSFRELVAAGQVELLGSTFAQNIPFLTEPADNDLQTALHRELIGETFGAEPRGFWNPERCWAHDYPPMIRRHGYHYTLAEDHIVEMGGLPYGASVGSIELGEGSLLLLRDDKELRYAVNASVWGQGSDDVGRLIDRSERRELVWAEDAEAIGLWALEHSQDPKLHWRRFDALISEIAAREDVRLCTLSEALEDASPLPMSSPPFGQAGWMVSALQTPGARFHESGYEDWFDYARRSPRLIDQRAWVETSRSAVGEALTRRPGRTVDRQVQLAFSVAQFERGCIGVLQSGPSQPDRLAAAARLAEVGRLLESGDEPLWIPPRDEWSLSGFAAWVDADDVMLFSPRGELYFWFDRASGQELCGNENAASLFSRDFETPLHVDLDHVVSEYCSGRSVFELGSLEKNLPRTMQGEFRPAERRKLVRDVPKLRHSELHFFRRTLSPSFAVPGRDLKLESAEAAFSKGELRWTYRYPGARVERSLRKEADGLRVVDRVSLDFSEAGHYSVDHALSPGYLGIMKRGIEALRMLAADGRVVDQNGRFTGVYNIYDEIGLQVGDFGDAVCESGDRALFEVLLPLRWELGGERRGPREHSYTLTKVRALESS